MQAQNVLLPTTVHNEMAAVLGLAKTTAEEKQGEELLEGEPSIIMGSGRVSQSAQGPGLMVEGQAGQQPRPAGEVGGTLHADRGGPSESFVMKTNHGATKVL